MIDPSPFPAWLPPAEIDYSVAEFEGVGFRGPLNRYRNHARDFAWLQAFKAARWSSPSFLIGGTAIPAFNLTWWPTPAP